MSKGVVRRLCHAVEFISRFILLNIPSFLLAKLPETDRFCSLALTYLLFQCVGISWAVLVNGAFAFACRSTEFLPSLSLLLSWISVDLKSLDYEAYLSPESSSDISVIKLLSSFYISYASIRVIIGFAQDLFGMVLESTKDFPKARQLLSEGGAQTLFCSSILFFPALLLEMCLFSADFICFSDTQTLMQAFCQQSGLFFLTSQHPYSRRIVIYALIIMNIQLWQLFLHQFPNWDGVFRQMTSLNKFSLQLTILLLVISTVYVTFPVPNRQTLIICTLLGWTLWLLVFIPQLLVIQGHLWIEKVTPQGLEHLFSYIRLSQMLILLILFFKISLEEGLLQSQLDLTFLSIFLPILYALLYLIAVLYLKSRKRVLLIVYPLAFVGAILVTRVLAKNTSRGCVLLVWVHIASKLLHIFDDHHNEEAVLAQEIQEWDDSILTSSLSTENLSINTSRSSSNFQELPGLMSPSATTAPAAAVSLSTPERLSRILTPSEESLSPKAMPSLKRSSSSVDDALHLLSQRGQTESSLVSLGLSHQFTRHWLVRSCRTYFKFTVKILRSLMSSDSFFVGIIKAFVAIAVILTLVLCTITIGSFTQTTMNIFPKLMDIHIDQDKILFDHRIANITLWRKQELVRWNKEWDVDDAHCTKQAASGIDHAAHDNYDNNNNNINNNNNNNNNNNRWKSPWSDVLDVHATSTCPSSSNTSSSRKNHSFSAESSAPWYAICDWQLQGLSLFDFGVISELAYLDDSSPEHFQQIIDALFPGYNMTIVSLPHPSVGPMVLILHSSLKQLTIVAVRGTDIGRLHDFLEDVKLFAEPVIFTLLSTVFPSIRLWSHGTTASVIEGLYELNSFFGLQGEAEYYTPLLERVQSLLDDPIDPIDPNPNTIVVTGHSLGGGLARIVGTLTGVDSISFSPPGLGSSYRKYKPHGRSKERISKTALHHRSVAVVTEYDWISQVDSQVGLVQHILCDRSDKAHQNACHLLEGTLCHLLTHCGDAQHRFDHCEFDFDITAIVPTLKSFIWSHRYITVPFFLTMTIFTLLAILPEIL